MALFGSDVTRWGIPVQQAGLRNYTTLAGLENSRELYENGLPRGALLARLRADRERMNYWMAPGILIRHRFQLGQILLGKIGKAYLGISDDRPMITIAGARSGKSSTVIIPNLFVYPGSILCTDPKGELSQTAKHRRGMGHRVIVFDAFGQTGEKSACFNCLDELDVNDPAVVDYTMSVVNAIVPDKDEGGNAKHFNDSARMLLLGLILYALTLPDRAKRNLNTVRDLVTLSEPELVDEAERAAAKARKAAAAQGQPIYIDVSNLALLLLLKRLVAVGSRFGGAVAKVGNRFLNTPPVERGGVFSTASVHTDFLDGMMREVVGHSDFKLSDLRSDRPTTIFLVLPVSQMERHYRILRVIVQLACVALEKLGTYPRERPPILFVMEEFSVLGYLSIMEKAVAYFPGFGVKLWIVLQSLQQLINDYPKSYQTFLGNSGLIQIFAAGDDPALHLIASRLGKLMESYEVRRAFSRRQNSQLLLMEGEPPAAAMRLDHGEVALFRQYGPVAVREHALNTLH